ncbi:hypothetical protein GGX14DRAFT_406627 [Mycena pura]|uniref:Uncharacterized protein n=1 Tax=Mycena pura TaxID=153505 RepID=A0AAD6UPZ1_9AGAR|nr:hypothetical protein GGX14DRAFT_406627 [Mycena pura]
MTPVPCYACGCRGCISTNGLSEFGWGVPAPRNVVGRVEFRSWDLLAPFSRHLGWCTPRPTLCNRRRLRWSLGSLALRDNSCLDVGVRVISEAVRTVSDAQPSDLRPRQYLIILIVAPAEAVGYPAEGTGYLGEAGGPVPLDSDVMPRVAAVRLLLFRLAELWSARRAATPIMAGVQANVTSAGAATYTPVASGAELGVGMGADGCGHEHGSGCGLRLRASGSGAGN